MAFEEEGTNEKSPRGKSAPSAQMTLAKAIEMGEYDPDYLATFPEWHTLSRHIQFEYIRKAIDNRHRQLVVQWAELQNMLDYRLKPHLKTAQENVHKQLKKLDDDREKLYLEYSK